jgi:hypothetical protein
VIFLRKQIAMLRYYFIFYVLILLSVVNARAADFILPSSDLSAQEVVEIQLLGLQTGKTDRTAGIEQVWIFAHPDNKRVTGPLLKFSTLFDAPAYAPLLGHINYVINDSQIEKGVAQFMLTVLARDGSSYGYLWVLRQANLTAENTASGEQETVWMTTAVSSPRIGGAS